jgi:hypothetical protein
MSEPVTSVQVGNHAPEKFAVDLLFHIHQKEEIALKISFAQKLVSLLTVLFYYIIIPGRNVRP